MNSFGHCRGSCHPSLSPPLAPPPIPGPCLHASASAPSVRANFLSELCGLLSTPNPISIDLGPGKSEVPQQVSSPSLSALPFSLPRPLARWSGGAARRRSETKRMVALSRLFGPLSVSDDDGYLVMKVILWWNLSRDESYLVIKVMIIKEVMTGDVSPVAMFPFHNV